MDMPIPPALEVGRKLVEYCQNHEDAKAIEELYADAAQHIEAYEMGPGMPRVTAGKDKLLANIKDWYANNEVHGSTTVGPYPHGEDRFAVTMTADMTPKAGPMAGQRHQIEEISVYTVKDGKIVTAEFYWDPTKFGE
ncbi:MAG: nuclear transport factor 2 family protein [Planctomycetota bacterium]